MERNHHLTDAGSRVARTIRVRADRLARSGAVPGMDADDIAQDLRLDLVERAPRYDPARASFEIRLRARQSRQVSAPIGESFLHFEPDRSGHANPRRRRVA